MGLTILADGSHPDFVEMIEEAPSWLKMFIGSVDALRTELPLELKRVNESNAREMGRIATSFEKSMQEHLDIIKDFHEESVKRQQLIEKELARKRRRRRNAKKKPKPKPLWKKILRMK